MGKGGDHVVITVLQKPVLQYCRKEFVSNSHCHHLSPFSLRSLVYIVAASVFCNTETLQYYNTAQAKGLGVHGVIYPIAEQDPIQLIQHKLKVMEDSGELAERNLELQKKARRSVERPKSVESVTKATQSRVFYYDPTYVMKENFTDHQGRPFAKKGSRINPLETVSLSHNFLFFDGDDSDQLGWAKVQLDKSKGSKSVRLILVKGAPLKLAEELKIPIYFDQAGVLTQKLGIQHIPAVVSQEGLQLKIEEMVLPPSQELKREEVP